MPKSALEGKEPMKEWARERMHCTRGEEGERPADEEVRSSDGFFEPWRWTSDFSRLGALRGYFC